MFFAIMSVFEATYKVCPAMGTDGVMAAGRGLMGPGLKERQKHGRFSVRPADRIPSESG
jgi:hypothetical protein